MRGHECMQFYVRWLHHIHHSPKLLWYLYIQHYSLFNSLLCLGSSALGTMCRLNLCKMEDWKTICQEDSLVIKGMQGFVHQRHLVPHFYIVHIMNNLITVQHEPDFCQNYLTVWTFNTFFPVYLKGLFQIFHVNTSHQVKSNGTEWASHRLGGKKWRRPGEGSMFVCGGLGQRGAKRGASEKQIHNASPTSKSVKISINPSAPITGKAE